ncbi:MAG: HipA N-terminal domain-containing protein [Saprospiraceae bacterium]|jgi:serine/threonine-protein kinase HipA
MRQATIKYNNIDAGLLTETDDGRYTFIYNENYIATYPDAFISFNFPVKKWPFNSNHLFAFFDGLIPEGWLLNIAADTWKINKNDRMGLLLACCQNTIGAVSVHPIIIDNNE